MVPPRSNTSGGRLGVSNTSGGRLGAPRTAVKMKQPLVSRITQTITKAAASEPEEGASIDEDEITEEMINIAYTRLESFKCLARFLSITLRYLQAKFIELKSHQAKEKAKKDCENQLFHAFSATEKLRQEMMRKQEEDLMWSNIALMRKSLELVEIKLSPALLVSLVLVPVFD